jgi:hypothetical protein
MCNRSALSGLQLSLAAVTQGFALGFRIAPFQGFSEERDAQSAFA